MVNTLICEKSLIYGHRSIKAKTSFPNGGRYILLWLIQLLSPLPPPIFRSGLLCLVYKGSGKDPFLTTKQVRILRESRR